MAVVRLEALEMLSQHIQCNIPELVDSVCVGQADASHELTFPSLVILPQRWIYNPDQAEPHKNKNALTGAIEVVDPAPDRVVMDVGTHEADIQLRLGAKTQGQRWTLEQKLIDLFLETPLRPGILVTPVVRCRAKLGDFNASWMFESDQWQDEAVFDQQFYSEIILHGLIPALVTRAGAHTIRELQLGLTHDFTIEPDETTFNTLAAIDVVQINEDGSFTPI